MPHQRGLGLFSSKAFLKQHWAVPTFKQGLTVPTFKQGLTVPAPHSAAFVQGLDSPFGWTAVIFLFVSVFRVVFYFWYQLLVLLFR